MESHKSHNKAGTGVRDTENKQVVAKGKMARRRKERDEGGGKVHMFSCKLNVTGVTCTVWGI